MRFSFSKILDRLKSFFRFFRKKNASNINPYAEKKELDKKLVFGLSPSRIPSPKQWRYLKKSLSPQENFIFNIALALLIASLFFIGIRFYQRHIYYIPREGGKYVEAAIGAPKYINPIFCQTNDVDQDISSLVFSSLIKYDEKGEVVYDLLEKHEISEDSKVYTFFLRQNVMWHDGESLNANDVLFTIEMAQNPEIKSPLYLNLKGIKTEKIDDYTFKLILSEPFAPFLSTLNFGIMPQHLYNDVPAENISLVEYNLKPIGSGPFKFKALTRGSFGDIKKYTLEKNEKYYGKKPYLDNIIFRFYPDITTAVEALKNKNVEGISYLTKDYEEKLPQKQNIYYYHLRLPQYTAVFYNTKNEILGEKKIREALAFATNKEAILEKALYGHGEVVSGPILRGYLGYTDEVKKFDYNLEEAAKLLEDAGWKMNEEQTVRVKGDKELAFNLTTVNQTDYVIAAEFLKAEWEKIGLKVEINTFEGERILQEVIKPREYDALLYGEVIGYDPDPYPFWHSSQQRDPGLNLSIYYKKEIDKLLEEARKITNPEERSAKYQEFLKIMAEEQPALFLYNPHYTYGLAKKVKGFDIERIVGPQDRFAKVEYWYINTRRAWK